MANLTGVGLDSSIPIIPPEAAAPEAPEQTQVETPEETEEQGFDLGQMVQDVVSAPGDLLMQGAGAVKDLLENADQGLQDLQADDSVGSEVVRATLGAPGNLDAKVRGAADFAGDVIGSVGDAIFQLDREESDTVWSDQYEYAQYDLTGAQTKTVLGGIVQEGLAFAMGGAATGGVSSLAGAGSAATAATALASDFVLDYFSNAEGGNISNLIQDGPLANSLSEALAHSEEDNPHWRRLKNSVEGLFPGMGVIGVQKLYKGLRAGNAVSGSVDAKVAAAKSVAGEVPEGNYAKAAAEENNTVSGRPGRGPVEQVPSNTIELPTADSPDGVEIPMGEVRGAEYSMRINKPIPGEEYDGLPTYDVAFGPVDGLPEGDLGMEAVKLLNKFRKGILQDIPEGTILSNSPASPDLGAVYERIGFSENAHTQYGVVVKDGKGKNIIKPLQLDPTNMDEVILPPGQYEEIMGAAAKEADEYVNGKPATFEPQERAVQMDKDVDINSSAASFWEDAAPGGGRSLIDEVDVEQIKDVQGLKDFIAARIENVDVDDISRRLSRQPGEYVEETFRSLAEFANSKNVADLEGLLFTSNRGIKGTEAGGAVVLDTLMKSVAERVGVLSKNILDIDEVGGSVKVQADQLLNRVEALYNVKKEATQFSSKNLEQWKDVPMDALKAVDKDKEAAMKVFGELRTNLNSLDPIELKKGKQQLKKLAIGLQFSKGDPKLQMQFFEAVGRTGWARMSGIMINSLLSGPLTHLRNIGGNITAIGERSLISRPVGRLMDGDFAGAARSYHALGAFHETVFDALRVGYDSFGSKNSITTPRSKMTDYSAQMSKDLDNIINAAETEAERTGAHMFKWAVDLGGSKWFQWPGKALQSGDDFSKTLLARMEMKVQAADEAAKIAKQGDPRSAGEIRKAEYNKIAERKLAPNGQILDDDLINITESAAFQTPLTGRMKKIGDAIHALPGGRTFFMPFLTTGVRITEYGLQGTPVGVFIGEYDQVVRQGMGTADQASILKGRVAAGSAFATMAGIAASQDNLTGYGPSPFLNNGETRRLWLQEHKPYSARMPWKTEDGKPVWVEHKAIPGASMIWSMVADSVSLTSELAEGDVAHVVGALPFFIASALDSQPLFQGFTNLAAFMDFEGWGADTIPETLLDLTNRAFGGAQLRMTFENAIAESMHEYQNWRDEYIAKATGGVSTKLGFTQPIAVTDVLTGEKSLTKYQSNRMNLINPFTTQTSTNNPTVQVLADLGYGRIANMVPLRVGGIPVEPLEAELLRKEIYAKGGLAKAINSVLGDKDHIFWEEYNTWKAAFDKGMYENGDPVEPKEESRWHERLDRITGGFISDAKRELMNGSSDVSQNYRDTRETRRAKLGTGEADVSRAEQEQYADNIQNFYKQ